jgi:mono/diheme cytochrome c family protein
MQYAISIFYFFAAVCAQCHRSRQAAPVSPALAQVRLMALEPAGQRLKGKDDLTVW